MRSYLAFLHSGIDAYTGKAVEDGERLAVHCIEQIKKLGDPDQFPPRLLILFAAPEYLNEAPQLVQGVHQAFDDAGYDGIPLIGSSVAAVFFEYHTLKNRVHERGALLICLASKLIDARVAVGVNARMDSEEAIKRVFEGLKLDPKGKVDPNPMADRTLLTFLPGFGEFGVSPTYPAPELYRKLQDGVRARVRIIGGVSSTNDPRRIKPGLQFAGREVHKDAVVAAMIISGAPIGSALGHGLSPTGRIVRVKTLSEDNRTIEEFEEGIPAEIIQQEGGNVLLGKLSTGCDPIIVAPHIEPDGRSIQLIREIGKRDYLEILRPEPEKILGAAIDCITRARDRILIDNPIASLMLVCNAWRLRFPLDVEHSVRLMEEQLPDKPCVGGFFDGEVGEDVTGRSMFGNGTVVGIVIGDEMRQRIPLHRGFTALASYGPDMTETNEISDAIDKALRIVVETGFPGAMLSLILKNQKDKYIVAQKAIGSRFEKIVAETKRQLNGTDILAKVARDRKAKFIPDSRLDPDCGQVAVRKSGIISQYVMPLMRLDGRVLGIIQVDLGDVSYLTGLNKGTREVLESLGAIVGASLNRLTNYVEALISRQLDIALTECLSASTMEEGLQRLIEKAVKIFKVEMGHVRLADNEKQCLILVAGIGPYYEAAKDARQIIGFDDTSLISQAFTIPYDRQERIVVIVANDAQKDPFYIQILNDHASNSQLITAVKRLKSFAVVRFENQERQRLGIISLASTTDWFFGRSHEFALRSLSKRFASLFDHFKHRRRLEFLLEVSPHLNDHRLTQITNLDDMRAILDDAIKRFCEAVNAQWGSLYIWDEDRQYYILRAQYGWQKPEWVNAARYSKDDGWTGSSATGGVPKYIDDICKHYKKNGHAPRYTEEVFGFVLSAEICVEAIGLPLKIGARQLGVVTLYRRRDKETTGFLTTDEQVLQEGAYDLAGLVNVLKSQLEKYADDQEARRRQRVYKNLAKDESLWNFASLVCRQMLIHFRAIRAVFYETPDAKRGIYWRDGFRRDPETNKITKMDIERHDRLIEEAGKGEIAIERVKLTDEKRKDPGLAALEGLVERVCIPVIGVGILDLRWLITPQQSTSLDAQHNKNRFWELSHMIGSVYRSHQIKEEKERTRKALQLDGLYAAQNAHHLRNTVQKLLGRVEAIKNDSGDKPKMKAEIERLNEITGKVMEITGKMIGFGKLVRQSSLKDYDLNNLKKLVSTGVDKDNWKQIENGYIELLVQPASEEVIVRVARDLLKEALSNLIDNSIEAILSKESLHPSAPGGARNHRITIRIKKAYDKSEAKILIADTGAGMSKEQIEAAEKGDVTTENRISMGVLISKNLLSEWGGDLKYRSKPGVGTLAIVTLPLAYKGERV
jgi:signal transduction histidine kinase